ncbi:MAG: DUF58 domain-containing protein [Firmicutes bacterium]|nr:DUF58 domain-containing protein [Bacillota bacterium]
MSQRLLDSRDLEMINQLSLVAKRRMVGLITGEQRSPVLGGGIEFADYRDYQPGDDIRRVDWPVFLRLRRLLVKVCAEERELTLIIMLDISRSMAFGSPEKFWTAKRLAAILAGIALHDGNRVGILTTGMNLKAPLPPEQGRIPLAGVAGIIEGLEPVDAINPLNCLRQFEIRYGRKCMLIFISDLLFAEWDQFLAGLGACGSECHVLQILAPEETNPPLLGEVTLVDLENGDELALHLDQQLLRRYRQELARFLQGVRRACHRENLGHILLSTNSSLVRMLHHDLRQGGLVC